MIQPSCTAVTHSPFRIHAQKEYSDQHWYEMHYYLLILHTNFIWWLVNGLKTSDCHRCLKFMFRKIIQISIGMKFIIICQLYPRFHMVTGKWYENFRLSPSEHVTIWKNYSLSYQYEHVTIWFVTKCILFIPVTILVWNFKMVTGMNSSYQASIWWHLSPYWGLVWKIFIPVTIKAVQMVTVWEVLP